MPDIFFISDTHFNHRNILNFEDSLGNKFRGREFNDVYEMNERMIDNWNSLINPSDKVYHLGDVYFGSEENADEILGRLNGKKRLVVGNHDKLKSQILHKHFQKIMLWRPFKSHNFIATHVPIHETSFRDGEYNVHGHIHQNQSPTSMHVCVCVEHINYKPINIDELNFSKKDD